MQLCGWISSAASVYCRMGTLMLRRAAGTCCFLTLLLAPPGRGQIRIALTVADGEGHAALVHFGYDPGATRCIDTALGEFELPPGGCGDPYVCASFRDVRSDGSACLGEGVLIDLRPFGAASDTFRLAVAGPDRAVTLRWQIGPGARFDSLRML